MRATSPLLKPIFDSLDTAFETWDQSWRLIGQLGVDASQQLKLGPDRLSLARLNTRLNTHSAFFGKVRYSPGANRHLVPDNLFNQLSTQASTLKAQTAAALKALQELEQKGGPQALDPNTLQANSKTGATVNLNSLQEIYQSSQQLLQTILAIYPVLRPGTRIDLSRWSDKAQAFTVELQDQLQAADDAARQALAHAATADDHASGASRSAERAAESAAKAEADTKEVTGLLAKAGELLTEIDDTSTSAAELQGKIDAFSERFQQFDDALTQRLENLGKADQETEKALGANREREAEAQRLLSLADQMMRSATVAGLAGSFSQHLDIYTQELRFARWAFYTSIVVLTVLALPLITYVFPVEEGIAAWLAGTETSSADSVSLGGTLARIVLLLPGLWLTKFNSRRYTRLFSLREEYAHKAAVAMAIEGFRREAPEYKDEMTAAVFWDLTRRGRRERGTDDVPNPILRRVLKTLEGRWPMLDSEDDEDGAKDSSASA